MLVYVQRYMRWTSWRVQLCFMTEKPRNVPAQTRYCLVNPGDKCVNWKSPSALEIMFPTLQLKGEFSRWFNVSPFKNISVFTWYVYGGCFRKRVADGYQRSALAQMLFSTPKDVHFALYQHLFQRLLFELMAFWVDVWWAPRCGWSLQSPDVPLRLSEIRLHHRVWLGARVWIFIGSHCS